MKINYVKPDAKAKEYRQFRESCGVTNPVELDEIEEAYYEGCLCAKNAIIKKACEWLLNHNDYQRVLDNGSAVRFDMTQCVMDFRKAMEE